MSESADFSSCLDVPELRFRMSSRFTSSMNSETENSTKSYLPLESVANEAALARPADDASLTADLALAIVKDRDLSSEVIEQITRNGAAMKSRKLRVALAAHPRTPRRIALRLIRELYTFDLMQFSLIPAVAADLKRVADELLMARLASITLGERLALARRSSAMVAAALLLDKEALSGRPPLKILALLRMPS